MLRIYPSDRERRGRLQMRFLYGMSEDMQTPVGVTDKGRGLAKWKRTTRCGAAERTVTLYIPILVSS